MKHRSTMVIVMATLGFAWSCARLVAEAVELPAVVIERNGTPHACDAGDAVAVLANEPAGAAGFTLEFDLGNAEVAVTPLARLHLGDVEKLVVKRPGQKATVERCVITARYEDASGRRRLAGSLPTKAGGKINAYILDVTPAVNDVLARPAAGRRLRLDIRLEGRPTYYEIYGVPASVGTVTPTLEVVPPGACDCDLARSLEPIATAGVIYREPCLPLAAAAGTEVPLRLLHPAAKVIEVLHPATCRSFEEGRDWLLREGGLVIPAGSRIPVQLSDEFFTIDRKAKDGSMQRGKTAIRLMPETWYHERQIAVSYEPVHAGFSWPTSDSPLADLPRLTQRLRDRKPLTIVLFGDSISAGGDCSALFGVSPYQPNYGVLVAGELARRHGCEITFLNPSRAGATSAYGTTQAETQVAAFAPDLAIVAYGMNDRADDRRGACRGNIERIIDTIRARSPETEFVVVTPMANNPLQPAGLAPVNFIRDEILKISRPGVAFADVTSVHLAMLERKEYLDLSGNGANHPNDFLHRVYAQRILEVLHARP